MSFVPIFLKPIGQILNVAGRTLYVVIPTVIKPTYICSVFQIIIAN